jgi:hypothetical protein
LDSNEVLQTFLKFVSYICSQILNKDGEIMAKYGGEISNLAKKLNFLSGYIVYLIVVIVFQFGLVH